MKILFRILLFLAALVLLAGVLAMLGVFTQVPYLSEFVRQMSDSLPWLPMAFSIVLLVFAAALVASLILILSVPTKRKTLVEHRPMGNIEISKQSIESSVAHTMGQMPGVKRHHVELKNARAGSVKLNLQVEPKDDAPLTNLGEDIQQQVRQQLSECLAIDPKHIHVKLRPVHYQQQSQHSHAKVPRVI